jgi:hypothetical protein
MVESGFGVATVVAILVFANASANASALARNMVAAHFFVMLTADFIFFVPGADDAAQAHYDDPESERA